MQIYPCLKIDHCNRRVDCRIFRILIKHDIQATKSMFGLSQSNLCCVVVFIPRLCMMAELLVPAHCVLCAHSALQRWGDRCQCQGHAQPLPVSQFQLHSYPPFQHPIMDEKISADHNSNLSKLNRLFEEVRGNCNIFPLLAPTPLVQWSMTGLVERVV